MASTLDPIVRLRTQADICGCIDLLRAVHELDRYPAVWPDNPTAFLNPDGLVQAWIALYGPAIVGHVALGAPEETPGMPPATRKAEVKRLFVGPCARGKRVATWLLDTAARYAHALQLRPILEVPTDGIAAIALYERTGWRRTGTKVATWRDASGGHPLLYTYERPL